MCAEPDTGPVSTAHWLGDAGQGPETVFSSDSAATASGGSRGCLLTGSGAEEHPFRSCSAKCLQKGLQGMVSFS